MPECSSCTNGLAAVTDPSDGSCPATGFQKASVCVPVLVTPFAHAGTPITKCCGEPVVTAGDKPCSGKKNASCAFTISQTICVEVPVNFGATATVGDTFVDCLGASADNICRNCQDDDDDGEDKKYVL